MRTAFASMLAVIVLPAALGLALPAQAQSPGHHNHTAEPPDGIDAPAPAPRLGDIRPEFELIGAEGRVVRNDDFLGRYVLLAFGFTQCTDVCPLIAFNMARVLESAGAETAGIFISVDTERDTPGIVDRYASGFDARITGLSGSIEQINSAVRSFDARYVVTKSQNGTTVQHTSHIYLIGPDGELIDVFAFTTPAAEIVAAMK